MEGRAYCSGAGGYEEMLGSVFQVRSVQDGEGM